MIPENWSIRQSSERDRGIVSTLLHTAEKKHQHLDWLEPYDLLNQSPFLLCFNQNALTACMACPPETSEIAWMRILAIKDNSALHLAWDQLWPATLSELVQLELQSLAVLVLPRWLDDLLINANFIATNHVVFYEWNSGDPPELSKPPGTLRGMRPSDLETISELDHRAFGRLWRNSSEELRKGLKQSTLATVFEQEGKIIGYQFSTASAWGGHLARLAVDPDHQGKEIGTALVTDLLRQFSKRGFQRITVNTQGDNIISHRLYRRLGFKETGDRYPVYEYIFAQ